MDRPARRRRRGLAAAGLFRAAAALAAALIVTAGVSGRPAATVTAAPLPVPALALFPPHRVSTRTAVEVWVAVPSADSCSTTSGASPVPPSSVRPAQLQCMARVIVRGESGAVMTGNWTFTPTSVAWARQRVASLNMSGWHGAVQIQVDVVRVPTGATVDAAGGQPANAAAPPSTAVLLASQEWTYEVIDAEATSTRLLDGAFVDIVHWSAAEGAPYNEALREMTAAQWRWQIEDMATAGIRTATIQALFINNAYPGGAAAQLTCDNYAGVPLYPSAEYPRGGADYVAAGGGRIDAEAATNFTDPADKLEAILSAADAANVSVFVGLGNFAWFTFNAEALCWTRRVAAEVWGRYGWHRSFYGWYAAGEMAGDFSSGGPNATQTVVDMTAFFDGLGHFSAVELPVLPTMDPRGSSRAPSLLPVMLAINSGGVAEHAHAPAGGWVRVAAAVDVLAAFGFARIPDSPTAAAMRALCAEAGAAFWVDMELFSDDMSHGLVPKSFPEVQLELQQYNDAPQVGCAYEFTGQMSGPSPAPAGLERPAAKALYGAYVQYYAAVLRGDRPWPDCLHPDANGTVSFVLATADPGLCAPAPGRNVSHVHFRGSVCAAGAGSAAVGAGGGMGSSSGATGGRILWTSMATSDPRQGLGPADCSWTRAGNPQDVASYLGSGCGVPPTRVLLPTSVCGAAL